MQSKHISATKMANTSCPSLSQTLSQFALLPDSSFVSLPVVCSLFSCSPATAWRRVRSGHLVAPYHVGARTTRWLVGELRVAIDAIKNKQVP